ncbi:MAG TPA: hypothetical protein VMG08_13160 [Allosphingosinicella sp.]|nr:hypothetical protein [Allosphingosinicella sp.]
MTNPQRRGAGESAPTAPAFAPVKLRYRHDGLTPARQVALVQAMAACGCIREACAKVGVSAEAVYQLRRRPDAQSFRCAMDLALDGAADRVEDAVFSRAIEGVEVPHYYKGELVGTHRRYDDRLALFILRYRKPHRYGRHLDRREGAPHPERAALGMADLLTWVGADAFRDEAGEPRHVSTAVLDEEDEAPWSRTNLFRWGPAVASPAEEALRRLQEEEEEDFDGGEDPPSRDVPSTTSTSTRTRNRRLRRKAAAKARKR